MGHYIKLVMDSGKEYVLKGSYLSLEKELKDEYGRLLNRLIPVTDELLINPSHISSIECYVTDGESFHFVVEDGEIFGI